MSQITWKYPLEKLLNLILVWLNPNRNDTSEAREIVSTGSHEATKPDTHEIVALAQALGSADAAIVMWTFQRWMATNKAQNSEYHFHEGRWWVYTGIGHLSVDHFPWISEAKMTRLLAHLDKDGFLLRKRFDVGGYSQNYWYSVKEEAVARRISETTPVPDPSRRIFYGDALPWGIREYDESSEFPIDMDEERVLGLAPQKARRSEIAGVVYLMRANTGLHKIGLSKDADRRLKTFAGLPFDVEYICVIETENMRDLESSLHKRFAAKRVKGEWFDLDAEDVDYIRSLTLEGF